MLRLLCCSVLLFAVSSCASGPPIKQNATQFRSFAVDVEIDLSQGHVRANSAAPGKLVSVYEVPAYVTRTVAASNSVTIFLEGEPYFTLTGKEALAGLQATGSSVNWLALFSIGVVNPIQKDETNQKYVFCGHVITVDNERQIACFADSDGDGQLDAHFYGGRYGDKSVAAIPIDGLREVRTTFQPFSVILLQGSERAKMRYLTSINRRSGRRFSLQTSIYPMRIKLRNRHPQNGSVSPRGAFLQGKLENNSAAVTIPLLGSKIILTSPTESSNWDIEISDDNQTIFSRLSFSF